MRTNLMLSGMISPDENLLYAKPMLHCAQLIPASADFWQRSVSILLADQSLHAAMHRAQQHDWSALRIVVPTAAHIPLLRAAFTQQIQGAFIPPRISTLSAWLAMLTPELSELPQSDEERLLALYAELRQHAWLKTLFATRRNTDLLPLAQTLLTLCDELTQSLLPAMSQSRHSISERWEAALEQLHAVKHPHVLSDEAQLVWNIWQSQLDGNDPCSLHYKNLLRLAAQAECPLVWISPTEPDGFEQAFLAEYGKRQTVLPILLDWRSATVQPLLASVWAEILHDSDDRPDEVAVSGVAWPQKLSIYGAQSLEDEAVHGAQTIVNWVESDKSRIAIVAQERAVARRMRALLERAQIAVADETGWKLSTTRAAALIAAWFDVVSNQAETNSLLNLLKSPFLGSAQADKPALVMTIELALRKQNIVGGWTAILAALKPTPVAYAWVETIAAAARLFSGRKTLHEWATLTQDMLDQLDMACGLKQDAAGEQILDMFEMLDNECRIIDQQFSFSEWRAFISMRLESTAFVTHAEDQRVVMLPLNGAHLRSFDAVLVVGADASHLPSRPVETLFFGDAVRRELGLPTRESRQRQQLRDFTELLSVNDIVVLSWQACKNGEPIPISPWIERLELGMEAGGLGKLPKHTVMLPTRELQQRIPGMPAPSAPQLLPSKLSASAYNSLVACPYQFFATRMLGLTSLEELSDMPEKRDYGDWLHQILTEYHQEVRDRELHDDIEREALLRKISARVFSEAFGKNGIALGYYARWQKAMPAYLAWAKEREAQGWRFAAGEQWMQTTLSWDSGSVTLHGRIDRIDENADGERAVLDYKTKDVQSLRDRLKKVEDHQLAFYGLLSDTPAAAAHYVALEAQKNKTGDAEAANYAEWQQALRHQIIDSMQAIQQGKPLHANGIEVICQYCDVRGLCRKGAW